MTDPDPPCLTSSTGPRCGESRIGCEVDFESGEAPRIGAPRDLFSGDALDSMLEEFGYDIMPDGNSFLITRQTEERGSGTGIVVVQNWFQEFREREPK